MIVGARFGQKVDLKSGKIILIRLIPNVHTSEVKGKVKFEIPFSRKNLILVFN